MRLWKNSENLLDFRKPDIAGDKKLDIMGILTANMIKYAGYEF